MRIIFFGTSDFAVPALKALKDAGFDVVAVVTVPDQPAGREHVLTSPPVKQTAEKLGLHILQPAMLKNFDFLDVIKSLEPDLGIVAAYGKIIPERYLNVPKHGFLNIHPSLLPKYRGPTPVQSALLKGEPETGVTIMQVDAEMDHGPIVKQISYPILPDIYYHELHDALAHLGAKMLIETIPGYVSGEIKPVPQDHSKATTTKIYSRIEGHINWSDTAINIYNCMRALNPNPGTWTIWRGGLMNIRSGKVTDTPSTTTPGTIQKIDNNIMVSTSTTNVAIGGIHPESKKETTAIEFSHGHPDFIDSKFE